MKAVVVIPVGPGHKGMAKQAVQSIVRAWGLTQGPFTEIEIALGDDHDGAKGRSATRNMLLDENPSDWHFLIDADDIMMPDAFAMVDLAEWATFGAVCLGGMVFEENRYPVTRELLFQYGARGTLSMGCFVRGNVAVRFDVGLDVGEDFDFYMRLPGFRKLEEPLVSIGSHKSAGGPRSSAGAEWTEICNAIIAGYR
jgi:hypothetical protein